MWFKILEHIFFVLSVTTAWCVYIGVNCQTKHHRACVCDKCVKAQIVVAVKIKCDANKNSIVSGIFHIGKRLIETVRMEIEDRDLVGVEYPGRVLNPDKMVKTLGGLTNISKVVSKCSLVLGLICEPICWWTQFFLQQFLSFNGKIVLNFPLFKASLTLMTEF